MAAIAARSCRIQLDDGLRLISDRAAKGGKALRVALGTFQITILRSVASTLTAMGTTVSAVAAILAAPAPLDKGT